MTTSPLSPFPLPVVIDPRLERLAGVRHAFFTRRGGVSAGLYAGLNVGRGSKDDPAAVEENRRRAAAHFNLGADRLQVGYQVHSTRLTVLTDEALLAKPAHQVDGIVTNLPSVICGALAADCAPVLIAAPDVGAVAAVHAGWRGALAGITDTAVATLAERFGADPARMVAAVGPCIGPDSYEVGLEFLAQFEADDPGAGRFFRPGATAGKRMFDLPAYVLDRLARAGVGDAAWVGRDTCAEEAEFFSNRRAVRRGEGDYGRLLSAIVLT